MLRILSLNANAHIARNVAKNMVASLLAAWILAFAPLQCAMAQDITGQLHFAEGSYKINVGDLLSVSVYNQPDLSSSSILVRSDGNASFNGIGEVQVAGKTIREATWLIESQVHELVREPRISLTVSDSKPPTVYLAGAVWRPGMLQAGANPHNVSMMMPQSNGPNRMDFRLSNVLSAAGGVKMNADLANVMVTRDGQPYKTVNLWRMLKTGEVSEDLMLQNGDSVYIPELPEQALDNATYEMLLGSSIGPKVFPIRIIGDIKQPGVYELSNTSPYLNSAIAKGGGYNPSANRQVVAVRRFTGNEKFTTMFIDANKFDFMLRPNDVIYVSEQNVYRTGRFAENTNRILSPFTSIASAFFSIAILGRGFR